jgi:hypothetical protein
MTFKERIEMKDRNMTRKEFLQTVAGAAASAAICTPAVAAAASRSKLRRGVSLYSYQEAFYTRAMTLEDCLREANSIGASAIELIPEEMVPDFPNPPEQWVSQFKGWMEKYRLEASTYTQFQDTVLIKGQDQPLEQGVAMLERDLKLANRLGFKNIRLLIGTALDVVEKAIPLAEKYGVWMGFEIHAPQKIKSRLVNRWLEIIEKHKTQNVGILPDFGIFQKLPNPASRDRSIRDGIMTKNIALYTEKAKQAGESKDKVAAEVAKMNPKPGDTRYVDQVYNLAMEDPRNLIPLKQYIRHFHVKFWDMTEDCRESSIAYEEVMPVLMEGGFEASFASEYEGQRQKQDVTLDAYDELEQVRRHHVMLRRLMGEI